MHLPRTILKIRMKKMTDNNIIEEKIEAEKMPEDIVEERNIIFEEAVEAILFAAGHPISFATLARVFDMTPAKVRDKIYEYSLKYNSSDIPRGVILLVYNETCQLCTKQYYLTEIREALGIKKSGTLSTSSLEALAIVAYNQPVTRLFVDTLRRADSSYAMNNLLDRGLIECKGRLDVPGRPRLYGTTTDFLRSFGIKDLDSLPKTTEEMQGLFAKASNVQVSDTTEEELANKEKLDGVEGQISLEMLDKEAEEAKVEGANEGEFDEPSAEDDIITD